MPTTSLDQGQGAGYKSHNLDNKFLLHSGQFMLPIAATPPTDSVALGSWSPVVVVQAHAAYRIRNVQFSTTKTGGPPMIPSPQTTGAFTFLSGGLSIDSPKLDATSQGFVWNIDGAYTFVETVRTNYEDGFVLGSWPFPNSINQALRQNPGNPPQYGAIAKAGPDAIAGYNEASQLDPTMPYTYYNPTFLPGVFLNSAMLNGAGVYPLVQ